MSKTMKIKVLKHSVVPLSLCASSVAMGQTALTPLLAPQDDANIAPLALQPKEQYLNRMSLGFQLGFQLKASFKHVGKFAPATNPGSTNGLSNHFYDNGTNAVDSNGNMHYNGSGYTEGTWFWGYTSTATVNNNAGTLALSSLSSPGGSSNNRDGDPQPGFLFSFGRQLYQDDRDRWRAGLETAFGFTDYSLKDKGTVNAPGSELTDTYSVNGTVLPSESGYSQGFKGPGIIISDTPSRSINPNAMNLPVTGERSFRANLFMFQLGPYFEVPLNKTFSFSLEGGGTLMYVWSEFQFNEQVENPLSGMIVNLQGSTKSRDIVFGGYVGARISAALGDDWALYAGAQWQDVENYVHRNQATGESAVLGLGNSVFFSAGVSYSF